MNDTVLIGTQWITTPNLMGVIIRETPKTYVVEVIDVDFTPKKGASGRFTHMFDEGEREYFSSLFIGQMRKFWKGSRKEIGNERFYITEAK